MGTIIHKMIVVTGDKEEVEKAHQFASLMLGDLMSPVITARTNGYATLVVAPDGSKLGWETQTTAEAQREEFLKWLKDNGTWLDVLILEYGETEPQVLNLRAY